ncbi:hypothetical protein ACFPRA_22620 [Sporosarcina soli]|uniref:Uncharacterized protein n=1 Tax=Sporosarcina soli TaxID=334736 RepID=A0ABW0TS33_9BACL
MTNTEGINQNNQDSNTIRADELAALGEVIFTVGYAISTLATVLALEEDRQVERQEKIDKENMRKQIKDLTNEVKKLIKQINNENSRRS